MSVQVISCTLQDLFDTKNKAIEGTGIKGQLSIPEYQRPYVWQEKQINQLLDSVIEHHQSTIAEKPMYYLGSILLHQEDGLLKIIDGQQRLTTSLLIQKITNPDYKSGITYSASKTIENIKYNLSYLKSIAKKNIFEYREKNVLDYFDFSNINVTLIVTDTEDLAYTFFETQNTGGVRLDGSDILKAHHLRAISCPKTINYQARRWEAFENSKVEYLVQLLTKVRFWDNRKWRSFPYYKDERGIKASIIDEYTINTKNNHEDISYHYSAVKNDGGRMFQLHESHYKQLKQPLANGNNTLDYINEYIHLHEILFGSINDYRVPENYYEFRNKVLHGNNGTLFLKELFEAALISYVSRFGFYRLYEAGLWLYRMIYSLRVTNQRNVREDSVFKFVYGYQFIDNIIEVFTVDELLLYLKKFSYTLDISYFENNTSKGLHLETLRNYFGNIKTIEYYKDNPKDFDKDLINLIAQKTQVK
ncbi:hypothetical protein CMT92_06820 [Elizabethkingia anophelis]|uniref:DUF262 domain-containing protein n=1 Tax=Elizabethkingia anophelis TaxID=1117645 RepID=UPI0021A36373|nr:DUF262 domain-containing protein [Elizabethkingia anophelis]MCT3871668.1 DUF262 domain-containing protein [Elizabethkingia anophelis]MDV3847365.1 hypothetical protein [Elizabethkingia anophelis]